MCVQTDLTSPPPEIEKPKVRRVCTTAQEWYTVLVTSSRSGRLPAMSEGGSCAYLTSDSKQCAAGLLVPIPDLKAGLLKEGFTINGPSSTLHFGNREKILPYLPDGVTIEQAVAVQRTHDTKAMAGLAWAHADFVASLNQLPVFQNVQQVTE